MNCCTRVPLLPVVTRRQLPMMKSPANFVVPACFCVWGLLLFAFFCDGGFILILFVAHKPYSRIDSQFSSEEPALAKKNLDFVNTCPQVLGIPKKMLLESRNTDATCLQKAEEAAEAILPAHRGAQKQLKAQRKPAGRTGSITIQSKNLGLVRLKRAGGTRTYLEFYFKDKWVQLVDVPHTLTKDHETVAQQLLTYTQRHETTKENLMHRVRHDIIATLHQSKKPAAAKKPATMCKPAEATAGPNAEDEAGEEEEEDEESEGGEENCPDGSSESQGHDDSDEGW